MSRSAHQRQQQKLQLQQQQLLAQQMADNEAAAAAAEMFDLFCVATTMRQILGLHRQMCDVVGLRPAPLNEFYPKLKTKVRSWKAQALWKKFDARAAHRAYAKGTACTGTRVLVIGAGPCGLRTAIEAQLLGAKVVVVEKRDRISRNNVLHLWPFVITDLRNLGAKKFYGKFCAGSIDHISIRQLQCILLKVALLLGVEIHEGVSFERTIEPSGDGCGWRASVTPADHAVSHYEFDVLIGADGKRNTLEAFKRKEFRGKLAIAITANFINKKTEAEAKVEEISGVAFIFNQSFFKELYHTTGIDLENIVYYKDETHYFVMTAKKHSLIDKGVILQDFADPAELLAPANVNTEKLLDYAREAAEFSTKYQMPNLEFAVNHYGKPDVAMFDFTSMFAAESSCRVIVRKGFRLLQCLVGDSLLEPFWPTGSGCARGFLSSMDAAYAIKLWSNPSNSTLGVVAQRESIYRLLGQTTPENLQRDIGGYTVDPATRYPNLNRTSVNVWQVKHLIDTDDNTILEQTFMDTNALQITQVDTPVRRKRRSGDTMPLSTVLLRWICAQLHAYEFTKELKEVSDVFTNGKVLCALINRYRPDLVDFNAIKDLTPVEQNDLAFKILDKELHIPRIMSAKDSVQLSNIESKVWLNYLEQICEVFRGEIPHVKHPKIDFSDLREKYKINNAHAQPDFSKLLQISNKPKAKSPIQDLADVPQVVPQRRSVLDEEKLKRQRRYEQQFVGNATGAGNAAQTDTPRRAKKRRSADKAANIEERQKRLEEIEQNRQDRLSKRRQQRYQQTQNFYKSLHMLQANNFLREADENTPFEDYSIFLYRQQAPEFNDRVKDLERKLLYPDRERSDIPSALPRNVDEQFSDRIKSMEQRISSRNACGSDKKPKDLMRAIGKIDSNDWNVREIEKKIEQSKKTEVYGPKGREKVPKWSREQFQARQNKMSKPTRQDSAEEKFKEIDQTLKNLDKQLKEGNVLEVGKVASIAGQFVKRDDTSEEKNPPTIVPKSSTKVALAFKKQAASEKCHFCKQTVYLMEKLQTENLVMHRGCLKCHHCHTNLRLGAYAFDRDDPNGRFYCTQHFRLPAKAVRPVARKPGQRKTSAQQQQRNETIPAMDTVAKNAVPAHINSESGDEPRTPDKRGPVDNVTRMDLLERGQTPERIEFENTDAMSDGEPSEEHIIDEHEWSGRNFLPESNNDSESDLSSSDESDSESDSDMFEEANDSPLGAQTLQLASEWIGKQNYTDSDDSDDFYDSSEGMADDGKDDTEGEEFAKARELRREEVRLPPLPTNLPTDTETEVPPTSEVSTPLETEKEKEKDINENDVNEPKSQTEKITENNLNNNNSGDTKLLEDVEKERKDSVLSNASELSFKSTSSLTNGNGYDNKTISASQPTKADIEKLEQNSKHKFSADIEAISEKLYRLNNVVKMNKDIETIAKENLIRSDILKKLTMKEKWLADNKAGIDNPVVAKSKFEERVDNFLKPISKFKEEFLSPKKEEQSEENSNKMSNSETNDKTAAGDPFKPKSKFNDTLTQPATNDLDKSTTTTGTLSTKSKFKTEAEKNAAIMDLLKDLKNKENLPQTQHMPESPETRNTKPASRSNSFKTESASSSPLAKAKSSIDAKLPKSDSKMELENILDIVKRIDLSKSEANVANKTKDMGHMLYKVENKFSPKPNKKMVDKLKEIEAKSFSGTLDSIKSQMETPTISAQAVPSNVDLSKYFPNQKPEKNTSSAVNKNQKTLNQVDLTKYFPSSPVPQRKASVVTVADKLKKSQTDKTLDTLVGSTSKPNTPTAERQNTKSAPKRQASLGSCNYSLKDNQMDGAVDIVKKKPAAKVVTTTAVANSGKKGNVKIIRKIVPKGTKAKKNLNQKKSIIAKDDDDRILDEILGSGSETQRSPSLEYKQLFQEEKSPSEDISDKIERILEETGIDLGIPKKSADKRNKLLKAKSFGEAELERRGSMLNDSDEDLSLHTKEQGDRPTGVQNILKRFESLNSVSSSDHVFKLRRMESTTSNLNKSKESIVSRESDSLSDLEKTMEYLKTEWRSEATNFLQKKRNDFHNKNTQSKEQETKAEDKHPYNDMPVQYRESKIAKFFGIKQKSPEKRKSPIKKKKSPEKKKTPERKLKNSNVNNKQTVYTSLEELALVSVSKQTNPKTTSTVLPKEVVENKPKINTDAATPFVPETNRKEENPSQDINHTKEEVSNNKRPLVEDIKNLPKTGCDKSLSGSRRGSQSSLQSRRLSNASLTDKLVDALADLEKQTGDNEINTGSNINKTILNSDNYDTDSLCTSISKSPSVAPVTVQMRGSSEDESIEKLFSQFSDEMLVNVEFDSNDELIAITPKSPISKEEQMDQMDILDRVESLERDTEIEASNVNILTSPKPLEIKVPLKTPTNEMNFPNKPQRRQKSHSSSSDSTAPLPPQRIKKKLSRLSPSSMPPSVQDLMQDLIPNSQKEMETLNIAPTPLKFPRIIDEDDILFDESQTPYRYLINNKPPAVKETTSKTASECSAKQPQIVVTKSLEDTLQNPNKLPENVNEFTKVLTPISVSKETPLEDTNVSTINEKKTEEPEKPFAVDNKTNQRESSIEWNMEMMPNSPMPPRRKLSTTNANTTAIDTKETLQKLKKMGAMANNHNKLNKEKNVQKASIPAETNASANSTTTKEVPSPKKADCVSLSSLNGSEHSLNVREKSPTTSIKLLNNIDANSESSQKRLIEEFELERRHALIQRDKQYQIMEKPELKQSSSIDSNKNDSKKCTPIVTPCKQSPRDSRRSSIQSSTTNRGGTPPMTKPLELPDTTTPSSETSRRSSFAFIEMLDSKPIIAPMPTKLDLPKIEDVPLKPDNLNQPMAEDAKKRPWPKLQQEEMEDDDSSKSEKESNKKFASETVEYANIPTHAATKRNWPDGKTVFSRNDKTYYKPRSETPETKYNFYETDLLDKEKPSSRSITDLRKLQSPYSSNYSLATTGQTVVSYSSNDSSEMSNRNIRSDDYSYATNPQRPIRHQHKPSTTTTTATTTNGDDASTQMLLERSKRLHNRKRDFVNERVVERNPYMKDVINEEKRNSYLNDDSDEDIKTYRPKLYNTATTTATRFPSSRALGRTNISSYNYDYVPSSYDNAPYSTRRLPTVTPLPTSYSGVASLNTGNNYYYKPYTSSALGHTVGRTSYLNDYTRRSPSQLRDRGDLSKDSCVQSESESTSPDEVELNSATEISTDSEFDRDEMIRETPKIFIDDTHLRKPTKVQIKSSVISPSMGQKYNNASKAQQDKGGTYLAKYQTQQQQYQTPPPVIPQFKPLVQVDPSLLYTNRTPLQNPRPGDYLLNKTASTEGIASKKSLELKKRYLLGEPANGNKIQKSGSTSVLDSRIRSFQSNISECQKLLNPGNDISPSMKTFLDRTKLGEKSGNDLMRSATNNILNDLKVEITIQKASSTASTDNEKENVFVNNKNELNKCLEFSETVNNTLLDALNKKSTPTTPTNNKNIIATIDLVTPEKDKTAFDTSDSNKVIDLTGDSPVTVKPDLSLDVKQTIPDILGHIEKHADVQQSKSKDATPTHEKKQADDEINLIDNNMEKVDVPEKQESNYDNEIEDVQIEVPNIAWSTKTANLSSCSNSSCSSHSSSLEDIEHYILESTTSPETHNSCGNVAAAGANHQVPRLEVHDTSGTLMQIDSLMIIDGKYIGDPDDLKFIDVPEGIIIPEVPAVKTSEVEDDHEVDLEPVTATPEPAETTVIEAEKFDEKEQDIEPPPLPEIGPPLPEKGPPKMKPSNLKFDTKNENKIESLKNLPLIVDATTKDYKKAVKPITLNLTSTQKTPGTPTTPKGNLLQTPNSPSIDMDKTPTGDVMSRGSDSETEPTGTAQILTETELSDWTADDCISENFIDMEFDHRSNKSNLKGGGRKEKKRNTRCLPTTNEVLKEVANTAPVAEFEGILKSIDIDDIEFMDTGSDGSGTEPLSATNTALLRNRGYMEFVESAPKSIKATNKLPSQSGNLLSNTTFKPIQTKRDEKLGIDYIEQGAYIMHDDLNKTPVNEAARSIPSSQMTQSLTDSSTLNDIEDESTCGLSSQMQLTSVDNTSKTTQQTTTEESEALTVVTSPFDSSSPQTQNSNNLKKDIITAIALEKCDSSTPSSSDRAPKTSQSTSCTNSATSSSKNTPPLQQSREPLIETGDNSSLRKSNDEISYEEYVRALQQKIVQISTTARGDSLEARKQRRKSSKGEAPIALTNPNQTVIESTTTATATLTPSNLRLDKSDETKTQTIAAPSTAIVSESASVSANGSATKDVTEVLSTTQHNKVPEIPTLTSKLEEITKERTKQKDLIHDLVMDKLQSKKQLNAEKRLHRSRQRTMVTSGSGLGGGGGYSSASSLSPTPKLAAANSTTDTNCTNQAHYHVCTAAAETLPSASDRATIQRLLNISSSFKENTPSSITSPSYVATYGMEALSPTRANAYKQRPFSEHLEGDALKSFEQCYKITKTPSFTYASTSTKMQPTSYSEISTPIPPLRQKRNGNDVMTTPNEINQDFNLPTSISTENLRSEARARARLKSNSELGLSPEEKMQVLRKRLQVEYASNVSKDPEALKTTQSSYERRQFSHSIRENKMNTSKSVNDLAYLSQSQKTNIKSIGITNNATAKSTDFTSDPNLLLSSSSQSQSATAGGSSGIKPLKTKSGRRAKDPERRKSLIQSLSNFFHKGPQNKENKQQKDATATVSDGSSAQPDRPGTGGGSSSTSTSQTVSSGIDGVLSRFRISPKTKEKSRDKEDYLYNVAHHIGGSPSRRLRTSSASMVMAYDCHNNPDFSNRAPQLTHTPYSHSQINNLNSNNNSNNSGNYRQRQYEHPQQQQQQPHKQHVNQNLSHTPAKKSSSSSALAFSSSSTPHLGGVNKSQSMTNANMAAAACAYDDQTPPPIPPLPLNYQRSDDESYVAETRDQKKQRAISKAVRQAELKRLRIAQEIQREQEEIEVQLKELETRGVLIEKALRGEEQNYDNTDATTNVGNSDEKLLKELLEIWRNITQLKKRDEELGIRQQELQLEHRHAQLKEELNMRLSCNKLDKSSADVAAEGAILNEMLEIVAKRAALRPSSSNHDLAGTSELLRMDEKSTAASTSKLQLSSTRGQSNDNEESNI